MSFNASVTSLSPDSVVDLYKLDLTPIDPGAPTYWFYPGHGQETSTTGATPPTPAAVMFGGQQFLPWGVEVSGFKSSTGGAAPRPHLRTGNKNRVFTNVAKVYNDLVGAELTRVRTLRKFLDDGVAADSSQKAEDIYYINAKIADSPEVVEWEMATGLDMDDLRLPARTMIADICSWPYITEDRPPDPTFECPWARSDPTKYFDANDNPVVQKADDECGRTLNSCMLRYGSRSVTLTGSGAVVTMPNAPLPFGGMPGLRRK